MKNNFKRLLTLLLVLILSFSIVVLAACNDDTNTNEGGDDADTEKTSVTLTVNNGNFATTSTTSAPYTPGSWSSVSTNSTDTIGGVISVDKTVYANYPTTATYNNDEGVVTPLWYDAANPGKADSDIEHLADDDNVLMLYNPTSGYSGYYTSSTMSIAAKTDYVLYVSVKTVNVEDEKGAKIYVYGSSAAFYAIEHIDTNGEWKTYQIYIQGHETTAKSLYLYLTLGSHNSDTTSGYAYFDNIYLDTIEDDDTQYTAVTANTEGNQDALVHKVSTRVFNPEFNFLTYNSTGSSNVPALYSTTNSANGNTIYRRIDTTEAVFDAAKSAYGEGILNPGVPQDSVGSYVYMLYNSARSAVGMQSNPTITFAQCKTYKVSLWVKTQAVDAIDAVKAAITLYEDSETEYALKNITTDGEWIQCSFYIIANKNENASLDLQFHNGTGSTDSDDWSKGWAFFDHLEITELSADAVIPADDAYNLTVNLRTDEVSYLANGLLQNNTTGLTVDYDEGESNVISGVDTTNVTAGVWDTAKTADNFISFAGEMTTVDSTYTAPVLPYYDGDNKKVVAILASSPSIYKFSYADTGMVIKPYSYYRLGVWVRTEDIQSTAGLYVSLYDSANTETALSTFSLINTESITSGLIEGWQELVFYIQGGATQKTVYMQIALGSGSQFTSSTLAKGQAYICNMTLTDCEYSDYSSGSSTYKKKVSFITSTTTSFNNGNFDNYDYEDIEGLTTGGLVDGKLSDDFGTSDNWTLSNSNKNGTQVCGIINLDRNTDPDNLIGNVVTAIGNNSILPASAFTNVFIDPSTTSDPAELSYYGGKKLLLISSTDVATATAADDGKSVGVGYKASSVTVSSSSYYELSVLVKTIGDANASIYLFNNDNTVIGSATGISTKTQADHGGWTRYTFYFKTGLNTQSVKLALYLGDKDATSSAIEGDSTATYTLKGGAVMFDQVIYTKIDENEYEDATDSDTLKKLSFTSESFETFATQSDNTNKLTAPDDWTGSDDSANDDDKTVYSEGGVLNSDTKSSFLDRVVHLDAFVEATGEEAEGTVFYKSTTDENGDDVWAVWTEGDDETNKYTNSELTGTLSEAYAQKAALLAELTSADSDSVLLIYNSQKTAYSFTRDSLSLVKNSYYKISFKTRVYDVTEGKAAYFKLYIDNNEEYAFNTITSNAWTTYTFYVKAPSSDAKVSLIFGLGSIDDAVENYAAGYAMLDDIEIISSTKLEFDSATANDTVKLVTLNEVTKNESEDDGDDDTTGETSKNKGYVWLYISSGVLGALIIIVVIVWLVRKYKPSRKARVQAASFDKRKADTPQSQKKKDSKYKNMKD